jgi:hypothetical protein
MKIGGWILVEDPVFSGEVAFGLTHKSEFPIVCPQEKGFLSPSSQRIFLGINEGRISADFAKMVETLDTRLARWDVESRPT